MKTNKEWEKTLLEKCEEAAVGWGEVAKLGIEQGLPKIAYAGARDAATHARVLVNIRERIGTKS